MAKLSTKSALAELDGFALKSHAYGRLTGISLAIHAIPDAFLVLHTGVGCKYKGAGQYCLHDIGRPSHHREGYTEVTDLELVKGSAGRIGVYVRSWHKKRRPAFMAVTSATFLEMTGEDFAREARAAEKSVPCPVAYIPATGFDGDLYDGYAAVLREVLARVPFGATRPRRGRVGVVGYPFDRYELDHAGNLQQLRHLLGALGLELGPVLLSGRPYAELMDLASCESLIVLPYARALAPALREDSGRRVLETDLPVGLAGTTRWLTLVAAGLGVGDATLARALTREREYARPMLDAFRGHAGPRLGGGRLALFAETPLAAGLAAWACELGLKPALAGLRGTSLGARAEFSAALARAGVRAPEDLAVLEAPSLEAAARAVAALRDAGKLALLVASHAELRAAACDRPGEIPALELGFPSFAYHALYPTPYYGFGGALALAQRAVNAIR